MYERYVAMATGVGCGKIWLALFNSPTTKTPCWTQRSASYLVYKLTYSRSCPKLHCHGNRGCHGRICLALFNSQTPKNPCYTQRSPGYLVYRL